jgi:glycosyltransferase involved in cell wall biosynthesis
MKILHVFDGYGTPGERVLPGEGSIPNVVYYLAKYESKHKNEVTIVERDNRKLPEKEYIDGIRFVRLSRTQLPMSPYQLIKSLRGLTFLMVDGLGVALNVLKILRSENFDIIHFHFPFAACFIVLFDKNIRKKIIYTAHADEYRLGYSRHLKPPIIARFFSPDIFLMRRIEKTVVLNHHLKDILVERGLEKHRLDVIPNGVELYDYTIACEEIEEERTRYGQNNDIIVLFAGTITPRKGVVYLIKAAEILKNKNILFLIAGNLEIDKEYAENLIEYVKNHQINARFLGFIPYQQLKKLYSVCDIFVLPSLEEGFGMVLTAAMAAGKPLIGTRVGGISMQIIDNWNGFLIDPMNEDQMAERIAYLIINENVRKAMGENSKIFAEKNFSWKIISEQYLKLYDEVLK